MNAAVIRNLARFSALLRALGVRTGQSELLDALRGLELVGWSDPDRVRMTLRATLVKNVRDGRCFDRAFAFYFAGENARLQQEWRWQRQSRRQRAARDLARSELVFQGQPLDLSGPHARTYHALEPQARLRLREFLTRTSAGNRVDERFLPVVQKMVEGYLERWRHRLPPELRAGTEPDDELATLIGSLPGRSPDLIDRRLSEITPEEQPRLRALMQALARRLASRASYRYRRSARRQQLDFRTTFRANLRSGGVLFTPRYRARGPARPRLLLILDVSGSMLPYAEFVSEFVHGLRAAVTRIDGFCFAERLQRLAPESGAIPGWGGGTDLARALDELLIDHEGLLTRSTCALVVSDTRTMHAARAARRLEGLARKVRRVIWLNPVPQEEWARLPARSLFGRYATMYECNTLGQLERIVRTRVL